MGKLKYQYISPPPNSIIRQVTIFSAMKIARVFADAAHLEIYTSPTTIGAANRRATTERFPVS
jgi:hypothetical protein